MSRNLARASAAEVLAWLRSRELRAVDVLEAALERIAAREPAIHAWAFLDPERARHQAQALDAGPVRGPLHGLPIGVKDLMDTADMPTGNGSPIYAGHRPAWDAAVVDAARAAGAIVVGKTVTTEFATFTPAATVNPHDFEHTPGGSSSGSAAAVAHGMVPLAFGTQTVGSIIRPASFCGVVGYKPTFGTLSRAGVKLLSESLDTVGAISRTVDAEFIQDPEVDVIVMSPLEVTGWEQVLKDAKAADKPVILSDRRIDGFEDLYATFIGADFVEEGRKAGTEMCKMLEGSENKNVWELVGNVGSAPAIDRGTGFRETAEKCGIEATNSQTANWSISEGKTVTEAWLK